jgi:hypothetical protein
MRMSFVAAACLFVAAAPAAAQTSASTPEQLSNVYACSDVQQDAERLRCFDEAVGRLRQAQSAGQVVAVDSAQARAVEQEAFGFNLPPLSRLLPGLQDGDERVENVQATVARIRGASGGLAIFEMENGQIWAQVEPQPSRNVRVGDVVTIERAALGSFRLISPRGGMGHRVRRQN